MCKGTRFKPVISFGRSPLVNRLLDKHELDELEPSAPLTVRQCQTCFLVQITDVIDSRHIYKDGDYVYYSSDMPGLREYYSELAADIKRRFLRPGEFFLELGSNDGIVLDLMKDRARVLGVDPATNVALRALRRGLPTVPEFFSEDLGRQIAVEWGTAKVVLGANCVAHLNDLHDLMRGVLTVLAPDGVFVIEANYWGRMVETCNYALIYHDHFSYFSLKNWVDFAPTFGLEVFDALVTEAQGGSLRVFMGRGHEKTQRFQAMLEKEIAADLNSYATVRRYRAAVRREARKLGRLIGGLRSDGRRIAGYGAAAKGLSAIRFAGIDERHIEYFVDDSPAKQGKYTPITHIPIVAPSDAVAPDYFLITAPSYEEVIVGKERPYLERGGKFITLDGRVLGSRGDLEPEASAASGLRLP